MWPCEGLHDHDGMNAVNVGHFFKVNYKKWSLILGAGEPAQELREGRSVEERKGKSDDDVLDGIHFLIRQFYTDTHTHTN